MTNHHGRLYALTLSVVVFFLAWAVVAAHPWATATPDPRLRALAVRETQLRHEAKLVGKVVAERCARYRVALKARQARIARINAAAAAAAARAAAVPVAAAAPVGAAPVAAAPVQVVNLPAHVITRTS